jgi:hypothetical protein
MKVAMNGNSGNGMASNGFRRIKEIVIAAQDKSVPRKGSLYPYLYTCLFAANAEKPSGRQLRAVVSSLPHGKAEFSSRVA